MRRKVLIIAAVVVTVVLLPFLLRKNVALLGVRGGKKIVARRSMIPSLKDGKVDVFVGEEKIFSLWEDFCDGPRFIYPFADGYRFFCDYNNDTAILDFVVDLDPSRANLGTNWLTANWPGSYEVRRDLARFATNVAFGTTGTIRLPTDEELKELRDRLSRRSEAEIKTASIPNIDFGFLRGDADRSRLLLDIATNRQNYWPLPGRP